MCSRLEVGRAPHKRSGFSLAFIPPHSVFLTSDGKIISNAALNDPRRESTKERLKQKLEERKINNNK